MFALIIALAVIAFCVGSMYLLYLAKLNNDKALTIAEETKKEAEATTSAIKRVAARIADLPSYLGYDRVIEFLAFHLDGDKFYNTVSIPSTFVSAETLIAKLIELGWIIRKEWKTAGGYEPPKVYFVLSYEADAFADQPDRGTRDKLVVLSADYMEHPVDLVKFSEEAAGDIAPWATADGKILVLSSLLAYIPAHCEDKCQADAILDVQKYSKEFRVAVSRPAAQKFADSAFTYIYDGVGKHPFVLDKVRLYPLQPELDLAYPQITTEGGRVMIKLERFLNMAVDRMSKRKTNFAIFGPPAAGKTAILRTLIGKATAAGITIVKATGDQFKAMMNDASAKTQLSSLGTQVLLMIDEAANFDEGLFQALAHATEGLNDAPNVHFVLCTNTEESMGEKHEILLRAGRMDALLHVNALKPEQWKPLLKVLEKLHPDFEWTMPEDQTKDLLLGEVYALGKDRLIGNDWWQEATK